MSDSPYHDPLAFNENDFEIVILELTWQILHLSWLERPAERRRREKSDTPGS